MIYFNYLSVIIWYKNINKISFLFKVYSMYLQSLYLYNVFLLACQHLSMFYSVIALSNYIISINFHCLKIVVLNHHFPVAKCQHTVLVLNRNGTRLPVIYENLFIVYVEKKCFYLLFLLNVIFAFSTLVGLVSIRICPKYNIFFSLYQK